MSLQLESHEKFALHLMDWPLNMPDIAANFLLYYNEIGAKAFQVNVFKQKNHLSKEVVF